MWRMMAFALLGCAAVELPVAGDWMPHDGAWTCCGALIGIATAALGATGATGRCIRNHMLLCTVAVSVGVTLDFLRVPAQALLDLCSSRATSNDWVVDAVREHCRWFPATMLAMIAAIVLPHLRRQSVVRAGTFVAALSGMAFDFVLMAVTMSACMRAIRSLAIGERVPWSAGGIVCAMLVGMLLFTLVRVALRHGGCALLAAVVAPHDRNGPTGAARARAGSDDALQR